MAPFQAIVLFMGLTPLLMGQNFPDMNIPDMPDGFDDIIDNANDFLDDAGDFFNNNFGDFDFSSFSDDTKNLIDNALDNLQGFSQDQIDQIKSGIDSGTFDVSTLDGYSDEQKAEISRLISNTMGDSHDDHDHHDHDGHDHGGSLHVGLCAALGLVVVWNVVV